MLVPATLEGIVDREHGGGKLIIDDTSNIGRNVNIDISADVTIGKRCWIGPNASIMQKTTIEDDALIGIGAVSINNVASKKKIMGLESLELRKLIKLKKNIEYK